jgi:two-component sensor histidine kinase
VSEEFDVNSVASLGLQLVSALVQQLHGSVSAYPDGGTVWEVKLTDLAYLKENGPSKAAESTTGPDGGSR